MSCLAKTKQHLDAITDALLQSSDYVSITATIIDLLENYREYHRNDRIKIIHSAKKTLKHMLETKPID